MFADNLKVMRENKGVSQQEMADYLQITRQAYNYYENGKRQPDYETLLKLAEYFGVTVDFLLRGSDNFERLPEELVILNRNAKNLSPENRKKLLEMAELMFGEDWGNE